MRAAHTFRIPLRPLLLASMLVAMLALASQPASAVCSSSGKACGVSTVVNDRLCCPGTICGPWGNVCQPGCRINGVAYRAGTVNPANSCQACTPAISTTAWSTLPNGTNCNDGNRCTLVDKCQAGTCTGTAVACASPDQCHTAACNPATGSCVTSAKADGTACNDQDPCTTGDRCVSGSCLPVAPTCPDATECLGASDCQPTTGACTPQIPVADGTFCFGGDGQCTSGQCVCRERLETGCYWLSNISGCWVFVTDAYLPDCQFLDSCSPGGGSATGGCYKWAACASCTPIYPPWS